MSFLFMNGLVSSASYRTQKPRWKQKGEKTDPKSIDYSNYAPGGRIRMNKYVKLAHTPSYINSGAIKAQLEMNNYAKKQVQEVKNSRRLKAQREAMKRSWSGFLERKF